MKRHNCWNICKPTQSVLALVLVLLALSWHPVLTTDFHSNGNRHILAGNREPATAATNEYVSSLITRMRAPPSTKAADTAAPPSSPRRIKVTRATPAAAAAAAAPAAPAVVQQQQQAGDGGDGDISCPPGIICLQAGSRICGDSVCSPSERCVDKLVCCGRDALVCNGVCCPIGHSCMAGRCAPPGSKMCGAGVCFPGTECFNSATRAVMSSSSIIRESNAAAAAPAIGLLVCCGSANLLCGSSCCNKGDTCSQGRCLPPGSFLCGPLLAVCTQGQQCLGNAVCCPQGATLCGGTCCGSGYSCIANRCVSKGMAACGSSGLICAVGQQCLTSVQAATAGMTAATTAVAACCSPGQQLCGAQCCSTGTTQSCLVLGGQPQCVAAGATTCGGRVCGARQVCADKPSPRCCAAGEGVCNGACCPSTKRCFYNQCVAADAVLCGTGVCRTGQVCIGTPAQPLCCNAGDVVCGGACCPSARCQKDRCVAAKGLL